jgi:hypothetical protein
MAYYIFLKSLRSLEEFRKNPHVKIPPISPSTNFQSLAKFKKNPIFNSEIIFPCSWPGQPCGSFSLWPSQPTSCAVPAGPNSPDRPIQPARRSRLSSRPPLPRLSVNRAPPVRFTPFPTSADPGQKSPAPLPRASDAPELLQPSLITLPLNPLQIEP